jgi:CRP-like cAMP-binding protein
MNARGATTASLVRKLEQLSPLTEQEQQVLAALPSEVQLVPAGQDLVREGERPAHCLLLLDGAAGRYRSLGEDGRQIVAFRVAGDFIDLASQLLGRVDHSVATVTPAHVLPVPHATILGWIERYPRLGVGFGPCAVSTAPTFASLEAAVAWVERQLAAAWTRHRPGKPYLTVVKGENPT